MGVFGRGLEAPLAACWPHESMPYERALRATIAGTPLLGLCPPICDMAMPEMTVLLLVYSLLIHCALANLIGSKDVCAFVPSTRCPTMYVLVYVCTPYTIYKVMTILNFRPKGMVLALDLKLALAIGHRPSFRGHSTYRRGLPRRRGQRRMWAFHRVAHMAELPTVPKRSHEHPKTNKYSDTSSGWLR